MHAELGTEPGFHYLYDKAAAAPAADIKPALADGQAGRTRTRGVEPWHQKHWDWKAAGNFLCGGAGAGLLGAAAIASFAGTPPLLPALAALAVIACGLGLLIFKIGRPWRFIYVLRQPQRSWMSREAWIAGVLFPAVLAALWLDQPLALAAAAMLGLFFLFCQGMILEQAKGIPAWRNPRVIALIMATGLAEGCGLYLLLAAFLPDLAAAAKPAAIALAALALVRIWAWWRYIAALESGGAPTRTLEIFSACRMWFFAAGLALPLAFTAIGLISTTAGAALFALAGLSVVAAGWAIKFILITRAAYNQGFALPHTPIRGSGVPGPAVKPGWSAP
jgi:phenylacetyl-CoA:acceptor oxidoreductase subunit 2